MDDTGLKGAGLADTLGGLERKVLPAGNTLRVDLQVGPHVVPRVLLGVQLRWGLPLHSFERNQVAGLAALWRLNQLDN